MVPSDFPEAAVTWRDDGSYSSAVCLGGPIVLTAYHALLGKAPSEVSVGVPDTQTSAAAHRVKTWAVFEDDYPPGKWDVAMLALETATDLPPVPLLSASQFVSLNNVTICGFGADGVKRAVRAALAREATTGTDATLEFAADHRLSLFDSGGPVFAEVAGRRVLAGINSRNCGGRAIFARLDVRRDWIIARAKWFGWVL